MIKEKIKYDLLHSHKKYGKSITRLNRLFNSEDMFSIMTQKMLRHSETLLDIGCGKGWFMGMLNEKFPSLKTTGVDIAEFESDKDYIVADVCELPFQDDSFDMVCFMEGMEHIPVENEMDAIIEMMRVAGKFIYNTISLFPVNEDQEYIDLGLGAVHINLKTFWEWIDFYKEFSKFYICGINTTERHFGILLKRNQ